MTDSTHIKASASKGKVEKVVVEKTPSQYLNTLEEEAKKIEKELEEKRIEAGNKETGKKTKRTNQRGQFLFVKTDPDSGLIKSSWETIRTTLFSTHKH